MSRDGTRKSHEQSIISAARNTAAVMALKEHLHEMLDAMSYDLSPRARQELIVMIDGIAVCPVCGRTIHEQWNEKGFGQKRLYCSNSCRVMAAKANNNKEGMTKNGND